MRIALPPCPQLLMPTWYHEAEKDFHNRTYRAWTPSWKSLDYLLEPPAPALPLGAGHDRAPGSPPVV